MRLKKKKMPSSVSLTQSNLMLDLTDLQRGLNLGCSSDSFCLQSAIDGGCSRDWRRDGCGGDQSNQSAKEKRVRTVPSIYFPIPQYRTTYIPHCTVVLHSTISWLNDPPDRTAEGCWTHILVYGDIPRPVADEFLTVSTSSESNCHVIVVVPSHAGERRRKTFEWPTLSDSSFAALPNAH